MKSRIGSAGPRGQRGFAVILIVLLVGVGLIVTVYGVFRNVQAAQEQTTALHARTSSEATAWYGAEGIRRYLDKVDQKTLKKWVDSPPAPTTPITLTLTGTGAVDSFNVSNVSAKIVKVEKLSTNVNDYNYRATAHIAGSAGTGRVKATTPIEVVYNFQIKPAVASGPTNITGPIFAGLRLRGTPTFPSATNFKVLGDVDIADIANTGLVNTSVNATGNVSITSANLSLKQVHANGDLTLANAVRADLVTARGNVLISGDGKQGDIRANGNVTFKWGYANKVETQGNLVTGEPYPKSCFSTTNTNGVDNTFINYGYVEGNVTWYSCAGGFNGLTTNGNVVEYHGAAKYQDGVTNASGELKARGSMNLRSAQATRRFFAWGDITWGPTAKNGSGQLAHPSINKWCTKGHLRMTEYNSSVVGLGGWVTGYGSTVSVSDSRNAPGVKAYGATPPTDTVCNAAALDWPLVDIPDVPVFNVQPQKIDANSLRADANYDFSYVGGDFQVTVRNVRNVPNDTYILGWRYLDPANTGSEKLTDYLCPAAKIGTTRDSTASNQKFCNDATAKRICESSAGGSCFHYENGTFVVGSFPDPPRDYDNANTAARGIYFFPGNLEIGQKAFVATWIAAGNITLGPNHITLAPQIAGAAKTCSNAVLTDHEGLSVTSPSLAGVVSTKLCSSTDLLINDKLSNAAMIAGSYAPDGTFVGGNITAVDGKATIEGLVLAGNKFTARGYTTVKGQVVAAGQSGDTTTPGADIENTFTLIAPPSYILDPGCLNFDCKPTTGNSATVVWSRYR
jgi:hypothetical protein